MVKNPLTINVFASNCNLLWTLFVQLQVVINIHNKLVPRLLLQVIVPCQ